MNANFKGKGASPTNDFWHQKSRVPRLSNGEKIAEKFNRLSRVHQRYRRQTDGIAIAISKRNVIRSRFLKTITYLDSPTPACLFTIQLYGATMPIKGRLHVHFMSRLMSNAKAVFWQRFLSTRKRAPKIAFLGEGVYSLNFGFETPKRHILERNRVF